MDGKKTVRVNDLRAQWLRHPTWLPAWGANRNGSYLFWTFPPTCHLKTHLYQEVFPHLNSLLDPATTQQRDALCLGPGWTGRHSIHASKARITSAPHSLYRKAQTGCLFSGAGGEEYTLTWIWCIPNSVHHQKPLLTNIKFVQDKHHISPISWFVSVFLLPLCHKNK